MLVRKTYLLSLLLPVMFFLSSCGSSDSTARTTAHKYLRMRLAGNFTSAEKLVTKESRDLLSDLQEFSQEYSSAWEKMNLVYTIKKVKQNRNSAEVLYDLEGFGEDQLTLVSEDGVWKVLLTNQSIPDAGLLMLDLRSLEQADSADIDIEDLDNILMNEDWEIDWANN